jgi:hypothetical protein
MRYELRAPSRWDRFLCGVLHEHRRWFERDKSFRRCTTFGCGMLTVTEGPLAKLQARARAAATRLLKGGGRAL